MNSSARRPGPSVRTRVTEIGPAGRTVHEDRLATEEPLEIRVAAPGLPAQRAGVIMRTPGHDFELAAGWLVHEGITTAEDIAAVRYCTDAILSDLQEFNVVTVELAAPPLVLPAARLISSACGVCGTDMVQDVGGKVPVVELGLRTVLSLPESLRAHQPGFGRTGGLHAAGLFESDGTMVAVREDVGRHNAVDKVLGSRWLARAPMPPVLVLSGRIGFELVQKAVVSGGIGAVVAVGAPTSLAVSLAEQNDLVLVGFTSAERCVVYCGGDRVGV